MTWFVLGIGVLVAVLLAARWFAEADPKALARAVRWGAVGVAVAAGLVLLLSGRLSWVLIALPALVPWLLRLRATVRNARNFARAAAGPGAATGRRSEITTRFLRMTLDHDSGAMDGQVREGPQAGRWLSGLDMPELLSVLAACRAADGESERVLEAYLDRNHPRWRDEAPPGTASSFPGGGAMSREEALRILGLEPGASRDAIKDAHRRLVAALHPDHGGSSYLAAQINRAKDVLCR